MNIVNLNVTYNRDIPKELRRIAEDLEHYKDEDKWDHAMVLYKQTDGRVGYHSISGSGLVDGQIGLLEMIKTFIVLDALNK